MILRQGSEAILGICGAGEQPIVKLNNDQHGPLNPVEVAFEKASLAPFNINLYNEQVRIRVSPRNRFNRVRCCSSRFPVGMECRSKSPVARSWILDIQSFVRTRYRSRHRGYVGKTATIQSEDFCVMFFRLKRNDVRFGVGFGKLYGRGAYICAAIDDQRRSAGGNHTFVFADNVFETSQPPEIIVPIDEDLLDRPSIAGTLVPKG